MTIGVNQAISISTPASAKSDKAGAKTPGDDADFGAALDQPKTGKAGSRDNGEVSDTQTETDRWPGHRGTGVKGAGRGENVRGKKADDAAETADAEPAARDPQAKAAGTPLSAMMVARDLEVRAERAGKDAAMGSNASRLAVHGDMAGQQAPDIKIDLSPASVAAAERAARAAPARGQSGVGGKSMSLSDSMFASNTETEAPTLPGGAARAGSAKISGAAELTLSLTRATGQQDAAAAADPALPADRDFLQTLAANSNKSRSQADDFGRRSDARTERLTVVAQQNIPAPVSQPSASTATGLANLISAEPSWRAAAAPTFQPLSAHPTLASAHTLKIQLHPAELGMVTASLRFSGDQLTVELRVENGEAYRRLTNDSETIVKSLRSMGLNIDQVTIQQPQASASTQGGADGNNASAGFGPRDQQSFASANSGGNGDSAGRQASGRNNNDGAYGSENSAPATDRADGGVYI
jgi:chemotaxis protein MotD